MTRSLGIVVTLTLIASIVGFVEGGPVKETDYRRVELGGFKSTVLTMEFKGGERASAILIRRDGASSLGLYVYDSYGNCLGFDDRATEEKERMWAVDWYPRKMQSYTIEVRNNGLLETNCLLSVR